MEKYIFSKCSNIQNRVFIKPSSQVELWDFKIRGKNNRSSVKFMHSNGGPVIGTWSLQFLVLQKRDLIFSFFFFFVSPFLFLATHLGKINTLIQAYYLIKSNHFIWGTFSHWCLWFVKFIYKTKKLILEKKARGWTNSELPENGMLLFWLEKIRFIKEYVRYK